MSTDVFEIQLGQNVNMYTNRLCYKKNIHYSIDAPGQRFKVSVAYGAPTVMPVPQKA
jgi:hypothetical protein